MAQSSILTAQERRKRNHDEMINDILTIAREMMRAEGVAALSFNAIARRLGMKPPSLYTYFESKHAIYDLLFRRGFEAFSQRMDFAIDPDSDLSQILQTVFETYMNFALENPDLFQLMFQRPVPGFVPSQESMAVSLAALERGRMKMRDLIERGRIAPNMPLEAANDLFIVLMHGLTELQLANNPESAPGEGRFGSLIPYAVQLFMQAWKPEK